MIKDKRQKIKVKRQRRVEGLFFRNELLSSTFVFILLSFVVIQ
jgi:hypothetical protein